MSTLNTLGGVRSTTTNKFFQFSFLFKFLSPREGSRTVGANCITKEVGKRSGSGSV